MDGKWLTYVLGREEVRLANVETQEIRIIGKGTCPGITQNMDVILERDDEIVMVSSTGVKTLLGINDLVSNTPKRSPVISPKGDIAAAVICEVFDKDSESKNAYAYRHFAIFMPIRSGEATMTNEQWYGGTMSWFPDNERLAHFEFDSTGGPQTHIISLSGERLGTLAGMYPSISPDGNKLAVRPRGGGSVVVYTSKKTWTDADVETSVLRIPATGHNRINATPPIWLDTRFVLVEEANSMWRIDIKRDKAEELKKLPLPTQRRKHSMAASPSRDAIAVEVETENGFELRVVSLT
jgi:hypothetical protein